MCAEFQPTRDVGGLHVQRRRAEAMPKSTLSGLAGAQPAAKKLKALRKRDAERKTRMEAQVQAWFEEFDENKDGKLQRGELRALLTWLHPSRPPSEENLDYLIERATAIESASIRIAGNKDGAVAWHDARQTVLWYGDYCKDQAIRSSSGLTTTAMAPLKRVSSSMSFARSHRRAVLSTRRT